MRCRARSGETDRAQNSPPEGAYEATTVFPEAVVRTISIGRAGKLCVDWQIDRRSRFTSRTPVTPGAWKK
jgi:hypothetical protein